MSFTPEDGRTPVPVWESFVLASGWRARATELGHVVGQAPSEVERVRRTSACHRLKKALGFAELFALWHGRAPGDDEWPKPGKAGSAGGYEWQPPEVALLASLVGQMGVEEIAQALTARLRQTTDDPSAMRSPASVQVKTYLIGMQAGDVLGGITIADAGREIGSRVIVQHAIREKHLRARRVGRLWVIPHDVWAVWKASRVAPPDGFVQLSTLRESLAIRSDKLSEFARMGHIPGAVRCLPVGVSGPTTKFGTWYVPRALADKLLADRRAGRPMPWHGKPIADNLRVTYKLWQSRLHPAECETCSVIWGAAGAPSTLEHYTERYPPLAHGAKRHLTMPWTPGLTAQEVAHQAGCDASLVQRAMANGMLKASDFRGKEYFSRKDVARWIARRCPSGDNQKSWLALETACKLYLFTMPELRGFVADGALLSKIGAEGAMRGIVYVPRQQCRQLRDRLGFSVAQAAGRVGVTVDRMLVLLDGVHWRQTGAIPLVTVQAVIKRLESREGYTLEEAAAVLGQTVQWVKDRKDDGTIRVARAKWDQRRVYISAPMLERLRLALVSGPRERPLSADWLRLSDAAQEAGVSPTTLCRWAEDGDLRPRESSTGLRYHRNEVRMRARMYWETVRSHRATPPSWLQSEE